MNMCYNCGYCWADYDENGKMIASEHCHYESFDEWAPCATDEYVEPYDTPYDYGDDYYIGYDADEMC